MRKVNNYDRVQALKQSELYAKDYQTYLCEYFNEGVKETIGIIPCNPDDMKKPAYFTLGTAGQKLCKKYNLRFPISPNEPFDKCELLYLETPIEFFLPKDLMQKLRSYPNLDDSIINIIHKEIAAYIDGRLTIMVACDYAKDQIELEFNKILGDWTQKGKKRVKESSVDIWEVHRLYVKEKIPLIGIAARLLGSGHQPSHNSEDDRKLKIITRAYEKSLQIIESIETLAKNND
jgi:hypothetical protein